MAQFDTVRIGFIGFGNMAQAIAQAAELNKGV